jgi:hypothetical protein
MIVRSSKSRRIGGQKGRNEPTLVRPHFVHFNNLLIFENSCEYGTNLLLFYQIFYLGFHVVVQYQWQSIDEKNELIL